TPLASAAPPFSSSPTTPASCPTPTASIPWTTDELELPHEPLLGWTTRSVAVGPVARGRRHARGWASVQLFLARFSSHSRKRYAERCDLTRRTCGRLLRPGRSGTWRHGAVSPATRPRGRGAGSGRADGFRRRGACSFGRWAGPQPNGRG